MKRREEYDSVTKLKLGVHKKFAELRTALQMREKLLLRQLEVVASTKQRIAECGADEIFLTAPKFSEGDDIQIIFEKEDELLRSIRSFGRFQLGAILLALKQEDYITPNYDHEIMYKNIQSDDNQFNKLPQEKHVSDRVVIDFSKDKSLIEHNAKYINDSIVNITLEEAKDLIRKSRMKNVVPIPLLNLEELDDELESSIPDSVSDLSRVSNTNVSEVFKSTSSDPMENISTERAKFGRPKQKITISNCNGNINLQNISNVTINCANDKCKCVGHLKTYINFDDSKNCASADIGVIVPFLVDCASEYSTPTSTDSLSNQSSNSNSRPQSENLKHGKTNAEDNINKNKAADQTLQTSSMITATRHTIFQPVNIDSANIESNTESTVIDTESNALPCNFYTRLLNEIKRNLDHQKPSDIAWRLKKSKNLNPKIEVIDQSDRDTATLENTLQSEPQVLKNCKSLNIVLENDGQDETIRPVHIEHWLSEIMKDTYLEPMQNTDMLEHSKLMNRH